MVIGEALTSRRLPPAVLGRIVSLRPYARAPVLDVLRVLAACPNRGLIGGGSSSLGQHSDGSDVDLWLIVDRPKATKRVIAKRLSALPELTLVHDGGFFPWMGELTTLFFYPDASVAIDIGFCSERMLSDINPGPSPFVFWGNARRIRAALQAQRYADLPDRRLSRFFVNIIKVRKNVARGHLWDASECLMKARRELMGLVLDQIDGKRIHYSRPERGFEDVAPSHILRRFNRTHARLERRDLARAAGLLCDHAIEMAHQTPHGTAWSRRLAPLATVARDRTGKVP